MDLPGKLPLEVPLPLVIVAMHLNAQVFCATTAHNQGINEHAADTFHADPRKYLINGSIDSTGNAEEDSASCQIS